MDNDNQDQNTYNIHMEPSTLGEALEDYFIKLEVFPETSRIKRVNIPVDISEDGTIPVVVELHPATRLN